MTKTEVFDPLKVGLPSDPQAERIILANILLDSSQMEGASGQLLPPADFSVNANGRIWSKMCGMHDTGQKIDYLTLASAMQV